MSSDSEMRCTFSKVMHPDAHLIKVMHPQAEIMCKNTKMQPFTKSVMALKF